MMITNYITVVVALVVTLAAIRLFRSVLKRISPHLLAQERQLKVIDALRLDTDGKLYLVALEDQRFLVANSKAGIVLERLGDAGKTL